MNQEEFKITNTTELKDGEIIKSGDIWAAYKGQSPKDPEQMLLMRDESFNPALDKHGYVWNKITKKLIAFHG